MALVPGGVPDRPPAPKRANQNNKERERTLSARISKASTTPAGYAAVLYAETVRFSGRFDMVFTSEPSYERFARELGARHVVVDAARELVPISGTGIRENAFEHRGWINPDVYATLIQ